MLSSSQHIANVASTKHPGVNKVSSDALPDKASRRRPKGRCDGKLHTHLRCKQQKKQAVDDESGLNGQGKEERRAAADWERAGQMVVATDDRVNDGDGRMGGDRGTYRWWR
jgi:hypothetical protein